MFVIGIYARHLQTQYNTNIITCEQCTRNNFDEEAESGLKRHTVVDQGCVPPDATFIGQGGYHLEGSCRGARQIVMAD